MLSEPPNLWEQVGHSARVPICVFDTNFRLIAFNQSHNDAFFRVNGYYTKIGDVFPDLFVPEQAPVMRALMARALTGEIFSVAEEFGNPALSHPCWEISYAPLRNEAGEIVGAFHIAQDIGPRLRAEAALSATRTLEEQVAASTKELKENRARLRTIFETSFGFQGLLTKGGILLDANATSLAAIDLPLRAVVGCPLWETPWFAATPGLSELVRNAIPHIASGSIIRQEIHMDLPVGGWRWFDFAMRPIRDDAGAIVAIVAEAVETTDRRRAEEALRQSQKMEAVGQLTGGLAHDFNNLLAGISGSLELIETRLAQRRVSDVQRYLAAAQGASRGAAALTHRLLAFSRRQTLDPKPTSVVQLVEGMEEIIRRTVGPSIAVESVAGEDVWNVLVDSNQLENALLNLSINARDAMPNGGTLTIEAANHWLDEQAAKERDLPPGQYVSMSVSDNGTGMAPDVLERAFDPFFTTKPLGAGTGLGLSMIYGFAQQSGGQVRIRSELGQGTTVCIDLPRHRGELKATPVASEATQPHRAEAGETVLVIDDEPLVRMLVVDVLEDLGYAALQANDGPSGMAVLRSDVPLDLLITDVGLPNGMNGRQVADAARELRRDLKILFITGFAENAVLKQGSLDQGMTVLTKPFVTDELARRVKALISDTPVGGGHHAHL